MRSIRWFIAPIALALAAACGSSYADSPAYRADPGPAERARPSYSPYRVEILAADSRPLRSYFFNGRTYVLGSIGERYRIHVSNPTSRRVEAVVSVDGLDSIDGRTADYAQKRGYVIPAGGEVSIDGFRTSLDNVATFRFSSVRDSYAGRKGQDRNVGVIGVAFFPEREYPRPPAPPLEYRGEYPAPADEAAPSSPSAGGPPPPSAERADRRGEAKQRASEAPRGAAPQPSRPGLGTEFGERRYSSVQYTTFQRAQPAAPTAIVELRYDDREGLMALGIPVDREPPYTEDRQLRENADPFPRNRFATPPP